MTLDLDKDTVNRVVLRARDHCDLMLSNLLSSLIMTEAQVDELWSFVKKYVNKWKRKGI